MLKNKNKQTNIQWNRLHFFGFSGENFHCVRFFHKLKSRTGIGKSLICNRYFRDLPIIGRIDLVVVVVGNREKTKN